MSTLGPASRPKGTPPLPQRSRWVFAVLLGLGTMALIQTLSRYAIQQKAFTYGEFYRQFWQVFCYPFFLADRTKCDEQEIGVSGIDNVY